MNQTKDNILVVDDSAESIAILVNLLSPYYSVSAVKNGQDALNRIKKSKPSLILLDVIMPEMDGYEVIREIKNDEIMSNIPVIFVTAKEEHNDQIHGFSLGASDYITKPVNKAILLARVKTHIAIYKQQNQLEIQNSKLQELTDELKHKIKELEFQKNTLDEHAIVSITDVKGNITYVNDKFCQISGYTKDELIGQNHRLLNSNKHSKDFFKTLWCTISKGEVWNGNIRNLNKDGSYYWVYATILPFMGNNGKPFQYVAIRTDITKEIEMEQSLKLARDEADSANKAKSEFLANMTHELKTPLNAILGYSQLLSLDVNKKLGLKEHENVTEIYNAGQHLLNITNEILDLSIIEAGKLNLEFKDVILGNVIFESIQLVLPLAKDKGITIHVQSNGKQIESYNKPEIVLYTDPTRVKQVIINFLSNAIKYNKVNGEVILNCLVDESSNVVRISVTDTGPGLSKQQQNQLFQPFVRLEDNKENNEGTGIGLVITKKIIQHLGGNIGVESSLNKGSTFWIEHPLKTTDEASKLA